MLKLFKGNITFILDEKVPTTHIPTEYINNQIKRDGNHHHITLLRKNELPSSYDMDLLIESIKNRKYYNTILPIGIGKIRKGNEEAYYQIVYWPIGNEIRRELNLSSKDFHVTLGFKNKDIHNVNKGFTTLVTLDTTILESSEHFGMAFSSSDQMKHEFIDVLDMYFNMHYDELDDRETCMLLDIQIKLYHIMKDYDNCLNKCMILKKHASSNIINLLRIGHILQSKKQYYKALFQYNQIYNQKHGLSEYEKKNASKNMKICREKLSAVCVPREKTVVQIYDFKEDPVSIVMSRNFSWVIPCILGGISIPKHVDQIQAFDFMDIGLVVSVLEEEQLDPAMFEGTSVKNIHYNVVNYRPPIMSDLLEIISKMEETVRSDKGVIVHCGGGKGRAGTVLACYILKNGLDGDLNDTGYPNMSAGDAIAKIRELRPGSIETEEQEQFINEYSNLLWKS